MQVLGADGDLAAFHGVHRDVDGEMVRADDDFIAIVILDQGQKVAEEVASLVGVLCIFQLAAISFFLMKTFLTMMNQDYRKLRNLRADH